MTDAEIAEHRTSTTGHFAIELSRPVTHDNGRVWHQNENLQVLADTLERAIAVARDEFPDATFHVVRRLGDRRKVLIDGLSDYARTGASASDSNPENAGRSAGYGEGGS